MKILLWLWQFPQHLLGLSLIKILKAQKCFWTLKNIIFWEFERKGWFSSFISGASFGNYIILPARCDIALTAPHEHGHSIQSLYLGPLYLFAIGIPSAVFNNLWDRAFHKNWPVEERQKWYYSRYPEKWADRLGGVKR